MAREWRCLKNHRKKARTSAFPVLGATCCEVLLKTVGEAVAPPLSTQLPGFRGTRAEEPSPPWVYGWIQEGSTSTLGPASPAKSQAGVPHLLPRSRQYFNNALNVCQEWQPSQTEYSGIEAKGLARGKTRSHSLLSPNIWEQRGTHALSGNPHASYCLRCRPTPDEGTWEEGRAQSTHRA